MYKMWDPNHAPKGEAPARYVLARNSVYQQPLGALGTVAGPLAVGLALPVLGGWPGCAGPSSRDGMKT